MMNGFCLFCLRVHFTDDILSQTEKQRYDGWFNNLAHPEWGSVGKWVFNNSNNE